jgi:TolB-like protein/DNA-binding SARP family transcriptional activator/Flp pilus assembly protein TadD
VNDPRPQAAISLRLLGPVELADSEGRPLRSVLSQQKRLALLAYLAHAPDRSFHARERLLALLWPEFDEARGRAALSQALYYLRRELGEGALPGRGPEEIGVDPDVVWCDVAAFRRAVSAARAQEAVDLYRGGFLEGQHLTQSAAWEDWVAAQRVDLRTQAAEASWKVAQDHEAAGRMPMALRHARRAVDLSFPDEAAFRRLLTLLARAGDRAGAIHEYEAFADRLGREYDLGVCPETKATVEGIRRTVEPSGKGPRGPATPDVVRPVPGAGGALPGPPPAQDPGAPNVENVGSRRTRRRWHLAAGALLVTFSIFAFEWLVGPAVAREPAGPTVRLAVLPFESYGEDPEGIYLADGMTEELIARLSSVSPLEVIARTSVMQYRRSEKGAALIGRELDVPYLLAGSIRPAGDRLRVSVSLIDTRSEEHAWGEEFDAEWTDVLRLQRQIAERVAMELPVEPIEGERRRLLRRNTSDAEAHLLYLRGRYMLARGDPEGLGEARRYFERALERDPTYARAWSGLSDALADLAWAHVVPSGAGHAGAREAARRALRLDPNLAEAHASLARTLSVHFWEFAEAERHFLRAIALDPSNAEARRNYASHLVVNGRNEEALVQARRAVALDPLSYFSHFQLAIVEFLAGRQEEALERAVDIVTMWPDAPAGHLILAKIRAVAGQYEEALRELDRADPLLLAPQMVATRAHVYAASGDTARAKAMLGRLTSAGAPNDFETGVALLALGEREDGFRRLEEAIQRRDRRSRLLLSEPLFDALRDDPRFRALIERVGLGYGI